MKEGADMNKVRQYLESGMSVAEVSKVTGYAKMHVRKVRRDIRREQRFKEGRMITKKEILIAAVIVAFLIALPYFFK